MGGKLEVPGGEPRVSANLQAGAIAIIPGRGGMDFDFRLEFQFGDTAQVLAQDFLLDFELMLVSGVLVMASATTAEMRAGRGDALRRRFDDRRGVRTGEARFFLGERGLDFLSGENKRDEYGFAFTARIGREAGESVAAVDELFNV